MGAPLGSVAAIMGGAARLIPIPSPSIDLSFTTDTADARVATTRSGTNASRVNSAGTIIKMATASTPRIDFDPVTLAAKGLMSEESRVNLCLQSAAFATTPWTLASATITTPGQLSPDAATAPFLKEAAATAVHGTSQPITYAAATAYVMSVYAKSSTRSQIQITADSGSTAFGAPITAAFDLSAVSATVTSGTATASIRAAGGGWYRCILTATSTAGGSGTFGIQLLSGNVASYAGDGTSGAYIWGSQVEAGIQESSYIYTTTATSSRGAERSALTGANFSSWFDPSLTLTGTIAVDGSWYTTGNNGSAFLAQLDDGTTANRLNVFIGNVSGYVLNAGLTVGGNVSAVTAGQYPGGMTGAGKIVIAAGAAVGVRAIANGLLIQNIIAPQTMPPVSALGLGNQSFSSTSKGATWVKRFRYWTQIMSDDRLNSLSI